MCNCEFNVKSFYLADQEAKHGAGESLKVDCEGITYDNAVYSRDSDSIETVEFNYCPVCGEKKDTEDTGIFNPSAFVEESTWKLNTSVSCEQPREAKEFLEEILKLSNRYNMSISHEDGHGAFVVEPWSEDNAKWLGAAMEKL